MPFFKKNKDVPNTHRRRREEEEKRQKRKSLRRKFAMSVVGATMAWGGVNYYFPSLALDERAETAISDAADKYLGWSILKDNFDSAFFSGASRPQFGVDDDGALDDVEILGQNAKSDYFGPISDRWYAMMGRHETLMQNPVYRKEWKEWLAQLDHLKWASIEEQAAGVDALVDREIRYTLDEDSYAAYDYWATPLETIRRGRGDCDDFAILKYYALQYLGVKDDRLYVAAVGPEGTGQVNHATLLVDTAGHGVWDSAISLLPFVELKSNYVVLDNDESPNGRLIEAGDSDYEAYYAMNRSGYWSVDKGSKLIR